MTDSDPGARSGTPAVPLVAAPVAPPPPDPAGPVDLLDESTRPRAPKHPAPAPPVPGGTGTRLKLIHQGLRREMRRIRDAVQEVAAGRLDAADARSEINRLGLTRNYRTLGAFCTAYSRTLTLHHTIEDQFMFPELRERQASLGPVVERLEQEHEVIAETLARLDAALVALVHGGGGPDEVERLTAVLDRTLSSHLGYEEDELLEPLDRLGIHV
ncbi:hemerythrin domain-containing protein [Streptomyces sp. NPDC127068]|uniref:hemerythrin domain-containing protein n=1 Tax=Streptomyces sp. NPDC127068 TaxID=3347127 RepID=UPI0036651271